MILSTHGVLASQIASFDADAVAFFNRVTTAGGSLSNTEKVAVNQLVLDMKSAGIWSAMKAVYPMVGASAAACAQNLKSSSFTGTFTSGWTFASTGATPNGTSAYMDTGLVPSATTAIDSFSMGSYWRTNPANGGYQGAKHSSLLIYSIFRNSDDTIYLNGGFAYCGGSVSPIGFVGMNRNNTTTAARWLNATKFEKNYSTVANIDRALWMASVNGFSSFMDNQFAFHYIGDGLTDTQASNFYTAVQAFQTTLSRQV